MFKVSKADILQGKGRPERPSVAKARLIHVRFYGTAEAVPFPEPSLPWHSLPGTPREGLGLAI